MRFLQGCYIDYDSTEGKLRHLKRKFNLWITLVLLV
jgi:gamma-butyrobetaine dioxygenase